MLRALTAISALAMVAPAVQAQDYTGNVNPSSYSGPMVMHSAINAQARRNGLRARSGATQRQASACAQKETFRAEYGADNPKVQRLYSLCRGIGR